MSRALGFDFGTTNSVLALYDGDAARPLSFAFEDTKLQALRTALAFWKAPGRKRPASEIGPWAVQRYLDHPEDSRFMQSLKTFAASPLFAGAYVFAQRFRFEDLLEEFFVRLRAHAGDALPATRRLVIGRPVEYAGASPDPALAAERYRAALEQFGFEEILFVYEPVAAAFHFARNLKKSATVLVADFGGGTTDFSILRFEIGADGFRATPLAHGGVGVAGDSFDFHIIDKVVLPHLGKGGKYQGMGKTLDLPVGVFMSFARWNMLSVLKSSDEFRDLKNMLKVCLEPAKIERMIELVEEDQGYPLYKAVSEAKMRLSRAEETDFAFAPLGRDFRVTIRRANFESWIAGDLARIEAALGDTLASAALREEKIDRVFLTGGTSFVPAVRAIFDRRFGAAKIESGDELLSIASGLALIGERDDAKVWATAD
ncbi:MAG TPA: Hsp70 family protein [Rhodoblastus sp.]|nr:Hsp70 family protein [Rhodoblastus sp.]